MLSLFQYFLLLFSFLFFCWIKFHVSVLFFFSIALHLDAYAESPVFELCDPVLLYVNIFDVFSFFHLFFPFILLVQLFSWRCLWPNPCFKENNNNKEISTKFYLKPSASVEREEKNMTYKIFPTFHQNASDSILFDRSRRSFVDYRLFAFSLQRKKVNIFHR